MSLPFEVSPEVAPKMIEWLTQRGGVAIWMSANLSNPEGSWSTPALNPDGTPTEQPTWQAAKAPIRILTDPTEFVVVITKEVKRFRVGVRRAAGFALKVTDGGSRRIRAAVEKAGAGAWHEFDYSTQEAVILVPDRTVPLNEWHRESVWGSTPAKETNAL